MTTHYRKLTADDVVFLQRNLRESEDAPLTSAYRALASISAVQVGASSNGALPANTPYFDLLTGAGVKTVSEARSRDLTDIDGIGASRAKDILSSLPADAVYVHVMGEEIEGLPGTSLGGDFKSMDTDARGAICRSRIRVTEDGNEVERLVPDGQVPRGASVIEGGLAPHTFAGA